MLPTGRLSGRIEATAYVTPKSPLLVEQLKFTLRWPPRSPQNEMARLQRWLQMVVYQSARHFTGKRGLHSTGFRLLLPKDVQS